MEKTQIMCNTIIFDIDGTLANYTHRRHLVEKGVMVVGDTIKHKDDYWYGIITHAHPEGQIDVRVLNASVQKHLKAKQFASEYSYKTNQIRTDFKKRQNYETFYNLCDQDPPIDKIIVMLHLMARDWNVVICTGRPETIRDKTVAWLDKHGIKQRLNNDDKTIGSYDKLYMRPIAYPKNMNLGSASDVIIKAQMLLDMRTDGYFPWCVFDDRKQVVDMWRSEGLLCCQVADGDF